MIGHTSKQTDISTLFIQKRYIEDQHFPYPFIRCELQLQCAGGIFFRGYYKVNKQIYKEMFEEKS